MSSAGAPVAELANIIILSWTIILTEFAVVVSPLTTKFPVITKSSFMVTWPVKAVVPLIIAATLFWTTLIFEFNWIKVADTLALVSKLVFAKLPKDVRFDLTKTTLASAASTFAFTLLTFAVVAFKLALSLVSTDAEFAADVKAPSPTDASLMCLDSIMLFDSWADVIAF